ncbi:MAG: hypothetical protein JWR02_1475 [Mucilaginibacter sp.]|nr:hypothetical protein [Mucilaginibacter sp.]
MNFNKLLILYFIAIIFSSCSHVYTPALYHHNIVYQPKPSSFDTIKSANYISVAYNASSNINANDFQESGQVNLSRGYIFNHVNVAFGLFGVFGDYENSAINPGDANYFTRKFFGAVGSRASVNLFSTSISERSEYRYLGIEAAYSHEFGAYANFRQYLNNQPGYYVDPRTSLFTIGLTTEILVRSENKKIQQSFRLFFGTDAGYNKLNETYYNNKKVSTNTFPQLFNLGFMDIYPKASYYIKLKNYFATIETGGLFLRLGYRF